MRRAGAVRDYLRGGATASQCAGDRVNVWGCHR